jgi:hypothetical protein
MSKEGRIKIDSMEKALAYDQGGTDALYGRSKSPHFYRNDVLVAGCPFIRVKPHGTELVMSPEEIEAYNAGYDAGPFNELEAEGEGR